MRNRLTPTVLIYCFLTAGGVLGIQACKENRGQTADAAQTAQTNANTEAALNASAAAAAMESSPMPDGIMAFDSESEERTVTEGEPEANFKFVFTNISKKDVTITDVHTSCSCTTTDLPTSPWKIAPGKVGELPVVMDVEHEPPGTVSQSVTLITLQGTKELSVETIVKPESTNSGAPAQEHN